MRALGAPAHLVQHRVRALADGAGVGAAEPHAADVRLVGDVRRVDLERHRVAERVGHLHGVSGILGGLGLEQRDAELAQ